MNPLVYGVKEAAVHSPRSYKQHSAITLNT